MEATQALYASVSYRKAPGTLILKPNGVLHWKPSNAASNIREFSIQDVHLNGLQVSKPGAAQVALRLVAKEGHNIDGEGVALLTFNAEKNTALEHREKFKERLAAAIAKARAEQPSATSTASTSTSLSSAQSDTSEVKIRGQVLLSNPSLLALHKEVVGSGTISDADFWSHPARAALLRAERAKTEQKQGRQGQLADPHPTQNESGELKINITPQLIRELFEQYPVLTRAYDENVPTKLDETTFWMRYFQSKLYHRLRTSLRSAASEQHIPDDDIFDKYLEAEDNELEPRQKYNPHDALLNLAATEEDHGPTGNAQDWTMQPGFDRRTLPLMRRFNKHAESLLTSSLGEMTEEDARRVRRKTGGVGEEYGSTSKKPRISRYDEEIVIDDLNDQRGVQGRRLRIQDPKNYYASDSNSQEVTTSTPLNQVDLDRFSQSLNGWKLELAKFAPKGDIMRKTLSLMLENMKQQKAGPSQESMKGMPPDIFKQLLTCHAATSEFLQQFWQAILPSADQDPSQSPSVVERARKAQTMLTILRKTDARIEKVAQIAEAALPGQGHANVMEAFSSTRKAVQRALSYVDAV